MPATDQSQSHGGMGPWASITGEDVYRAVKAYADTHPRLAGEERQVAQGNDARLHARRCWGLPKEQRDEVEALRKKALRPDDGL